MRDYNQSMFEAEQRGKQEQAIIIAKNLISLGCNVNFILFWQNTPTFKRTK